MSMPHTTKADRRVPLAVAILGLVLACLGTASIAESAPAAPFAAVGQ